MIKTRTKEVKSIKIEEILMVKMMINITTTMIMPIMTIICIKLMIIKIYNRMKYKISKTKGLQIKGFNVCLKRGKCLESQMLLKSKSYKT